MLDILTAIALAASTTPAVAAQPTTLEGLETVKFRKDIPYSERHELNAERAAKKADCELPKDGFGWVHARVEAAIYFSADGSVEKVIPVTIKCPALEDFVVRHFVRYGRNAGPASSSANRKWYRTAMHFRWPE